MLSQAQEGEGAGAAAQAIPPPVPETIPKTRPESDQPQEIVEDEPLRGSFHASPPRSTQASPTGHTSGGAEDHITLFALSSVVSTLVQKVNSLETELKAHKQLFKEVVAKLVKKVKALEVKLKTKKRKVVLTVSVDEYEVIQNGNSLKRTGREYDGRVIILPPMTADEHIVVQRELKARTTLLQSMGEEDMHEIN
ncbi:hypothetical protein Tco_0887027 [Tanacetum coccineum]